MGTTIGMGTAEGAEVSYARGILSDAGMEEGTDHEFLPVGDGGPATAAFEGGEIVAYSAAIPDMAILYLEACDTTGMAGRFGSPQFVFSEAPLATMRSVMRSARAGHEPASKASIRDRGSVKMRGRCPDAHGLSLLTLLVRLVRPRVVAARRPSMESGILTDRTPSALTRPTRLQGGSMKLLVAAASKHGATSEIAEELGRTFREDGVDADVQAAGQVTSLDDYEAVVLGSAV